jgi:phage shock protein PspC (stress-responsive transcriptional regulator)
MTDHYPPAPRRQLRRSRNRLLGGICAGIAEYFGVDPVLLRIGAVVLALFTGGGAVLAYLAAWVLVPQAPRVDTGLDLHAAEPPGPVAAPDVRTAWNTVGGDLRSLAGGLRQDPAATANRPAPGIGDRLRDPDVQAGARRAAGNFADALNVSADELGRRIRRTS